MIVLNVYYKAKPGQRSTFYNLVHEEDIPSKSREEAGNIKYDYYMASDEEDVVLLIEHWKDDDAFDFHTKQDHFKRLQEIKAEYVVDVHIDRFVTAD